MWIFYYSGVISIHCSDSVAAISQRFSCKTLERLLVNPGKAGKWPLYGCVIESSFPSVLDLRCTTALESPAIKGTAINQKKNLFAFVFHVS